MTLTRFKSPFKARQLRRAKQQPMHKDIYVLGEFDEEGNFLGFVENQNEPNQTRAYIGNRSARSGMNIYRRKNPDKIIEAMWVETFRIARFYNKSGTVGASNILPNDIKKWEESTGKKFDPKGMEVADEKWFRGRTDWSDKDKRV